MVQGMGLSEREKVFILQHKEEMFIGQMAKELNRHRETIKNFLNKTE